MLLVAQLVHVQLLYGTRGIQLPVTVTETEIQAYLRTQCRLENTNGNVQPESESSSSTSIILFCEKSADECQMLET